MNKKTIQSPIYVNRKNRETVQSLIYVTRKKKRKTQSPIYVNRKKKKCFNCGHDKCKNDDKPQKYEKEDNISINLAVNCGDSHKDQNDCDSCINTNPANGYSVEEGSGTTASGFASHAEGLNTTAGGLYSHAEGFGTSAIGGRSHTQGALTEARAESSHAEGIMTTVEETDTCSHIMGTNGSTRFPNSWHLANGLVDGPALNSAIIEGLTGNIFLDGAIISPNAADYAEMFETIDGNSIDVGFFVTLEGDKIRKANTHDNFILGIVSATPAMIADASDLRWHDLFVKDEWGRVQYHEVLVPEVKDEEGKVNIPSFTKYEPILNPEWDSSQEYIPRLQRPEWVAIGLLGKLLVRDDGTCQPGGYCKPNNEGIATKANQGYRVLKRTRANQVLVLVK